MLLIFLSTQFLFPLFIVAFDVILCIQSFVALNINFARLIMDIESLVPNKRICLPKVFYYTYSEVFWNFKTYIYLHCGGK
jgi:hypothetical protein